MQTMQIKENLLLHVQYTDQLDRNAMRYSSLLPARVKNQMGALTCRKQFITQSRAARPGFTPRLLTCWWLLTVVVVVTSSPDDQFNNKTTPALSSHAGSSPVKRPSCAWKQLWSLTLTLQHRVKETEANNLTNMKIKQFHNTMISCY